MSSRYYNNYFSPPQYSQPYRPRVTNKSSPYYYSKPSPQYTVKSPKSKDASNVIRESGGGSYSPNALGRKKPFGQWKAKKKQDKESMDKKTKLGEFNQEAIEAELNKYKKGVFYHNDDKDKEKSKNKNKINGHIKSTTKDTQYSQFQLTRTEKPPPPIYDDLPRAVPPNYDERIQSTESSENIDENKKQSDAIIKKTSTSISKKPRSKQVIEDTKQREDNTKTTSSSSPIKTPSSVTKKRSHRTSRGIPQSMVTVSPYRLQAGTRGGTGRGGGGRGRGPYAMYGPPPPPPPNTGPSGHSGHSGAPDAYYQTGYYSAAAAAPPQLPPNYGYYENNYGREEMYAAMPPPQEYQSYNTYNTYNQYGAPYDYTRGVVQNDGSWYPYPDVLAPRQPPPAPAGAPGGSGKDYITPKKKRKTTKEKAMVDLTTPIVDRDRDRDKDKPMSPGRRVNKIQKQLEYYFSATNMNGDEFLCDSMDSKGYVSIDILLAFKRMKSLNATKELVIEAAYHSTSIEIDPKHEDKLRMTKYWKQYVKRKQKKERDKKTAIKDKDKEREKELDNAELNPQTIESIVAGIEKKHEKRKKRRQQREREKEKARKEQQKREKEKEKGHDTDENKQEEEEEEEEEEVIIVDIANEDGNDEEDEDAQELIKKDKEEENDNDCGDPNHADMLEID